MDKALYYHLKNNHYPPLSENLIPACKEAIDKARAGKWEEHITGIETKSGQKVTVREFIENMRLEDFLEGDTPLT